MIGGPRARWDGIDTLRAAIPSAGSGVRPDEARCSRRRSSTSRSRSCGRSRSDQIDGVVDLLRRTRDARRARLLLRLGRRRRPRLPRHVRLPQARRDRVLLGDRQRVRADGAHQRRGLGHVVRRVARDLAPRTRRTSSSCSPSAAATSNATSASTSSTPCATPRRSAPSVTGIVGRDGGAVAALGDVDGRDPGGRSGDGDTADRGHAGADVAPDRQPPRSRGAAGEVGVDRMSRRSATGSPGRERVRLVERRDGRLQRGAHRRRCHRPGAQGRPRRAAARVDDRREQLDRRHAGDRAVVRGTIRTSG